MSEAHGGYHRQDYQPGATVPLQGVRIVDLSRLVAGNVVTHVLADYGADVIKVEDPRCGDDLRAWTVADVPTFWKVYCRGKRSLALDTRTPEGLAVLRDLVATAHVVVENFVPGTLEKLGLDPTDLLARTSHLVVARASGWEQTGPFRTKPGFGSLVEAMSGFASMNGFPDRPPVLPPLALADMITGLYGATAVMVALRHAEEPYVIERECIVSLPDAETGQLPMHNIVARLSRTPGALRARHRGWASIATLSWRIWD